MKKKLLISALGFVLSFGIKVLAATPELPDFLPEYYAPVFTINDNIELNLLTHSTTNGSENWRYEATDHALYLTVEFASCNSSQTEIIFNNVLAYLNDQASQHGGRCNVIDADNAYVSTTEAGSENHFFIFRLNNGVQIWTYSAKKKDLINSEQFNLVKSRVNQQRYTEANREGHVAMGKWEDAICEYATELLLSGRKKDALKVLGELIVTSPYNYDAHLTFMNNTTDAEAATNSAAVVAANSEDSEERRQAEGFLEKKSFLEEELPYLNHNERGLQVILIALPPCNVPLLKESADIYQDMVGVPVKICRLKEEWIWNKPDRFANQKAIEDLLLDIKGEKINFSDWERDKYVDELRSAKAGLGIFYAHYAEELIEEMDHEGGQYRVDTYLDKLCDILEDYRSDDERTMYIGVTEMNIFSENNNFLFSIGRIQGESLASVLSYHMMQADVLGEAYAFRPRLAERLAKEMVPASLKQLGIPRSSDPRCPYSYSSGISRLDEKTTTLSAPAKKALQNFTTPKAKEE